MSGWLRAILEIGPGITFGIAVYGITTLWALVEGSLRPRLIPRREIEALADAVMRAHPDDPEEWALMEEEAAWYRSHAVERGRWRRVRSVLRARRDQRP